MAVQDGRMFQDLMARLAGTAGAVGPAVQAAGKRPGATTSAVLAGGQLLGGDAMGAAASLGGGLLGGGLGSAAANLLPGPLRAIGKIGLPIVGSLAGAGLAEQGAQAAGGFLGAQIPGAGEVAGRRQEKREREFQRQQLQADVAARSASEMAATREMLGFTMDKEVEQQKAMLPIMEQMQRTQLVNAQSMLASQTAAYQQLGRSAMAGKLALGGQAERGATIRQALASNPYMGSVLQAPNISF